MLVENNAEEDEAQVILEGSAEPDFFKSLSCFSPDGTSLVGAEIAESSGDFADFQYDSAKKELQEVELAYPAGDYWCVATTPADTVLISTATLSYELPEPITPQSPANGTTGVAVDDLVISWAAAADASSISIDIENTATGTSLEVDLLGSATSFVVPNDFLEDGTLYEVGLEAINEDGNKSVTEDYSFTTVGVAEEDDDGDENTSGDFESLELYVVFNATDDDDDAQLIIAAEAQMTLS